MTQATKTPMELMTALSPEAASIYMAQRVAVMDSPEFAALPTRTKLLIGIGVAASLQSSTCTLMWTRLARQAGAGDAEIAATLAVSRLMKSATVNDTAAEALAWLLEHPLTPATEQAKG